MPRAAAGLQVIWALILVVPGCNVGDRAVPLAIQPGPGVAVGQDGAVDGRVEVPPGTDGGQGTIKKSGNDSGPGTGTGDTTTCVFINGTGKQYCGVATSYPGPLAFDCWGQGSCSVQVKAPAGTELTWKSSCGGYAYSLVDGQPDTIGFHCGPGSDQSKMEQVTCTFAGSTKLESCSTTGLPGPFRCSGMGSCQVWVLTVPGTKLTWTSSCTGQHQTVVGGGGGTLPFSCP